MKTLAIANQKGGVGKTTLTVHLTYAAVEAGLRVLLIDMDAQANASLSFPSVEGSKPGLLASGLYRSAPSEALPEILDDRLSIIRADNALLSVDKAENEVIRRPAQALRRFAADYDLCLIDTPPLLGVRLMASLAASGYVLTPVRIGLYEMSGVADLMQTIHVVRTQGFNPRLRHIGMLPIKTNSRSSKAWKALDELRERYGAEVILPEVLPERAAVNEAVALRRPVWMKARGEGHVKAAQEWRVACDSVLGRVLK
jgi:chromosome partitioning protein